MTKAPRTRTGREVLDYILAHPEAGPSEIAKATGCSRNTAKVYLRSRRGADPEVGGQPDQAPPPVAGGQTVQPEGRDFDQDFPAAPKKPADPAPPPADDGDDEDDGDLEW